MQQPYTKNLGRRYGKVPAAVGAYGVLKEYHISIWKSIKLQDAEERANQSQSKGADDQHDGADLLLLQEVVHQEDVTDG